jgi:hypothetical protein
VDAASPPAQQVVGCTSAQRDARSVTLKLGGMAANGRGPRRLRAQLRPGDLCLIRSSPGAVGRDGCARKWSMKVQLRPTAWQRVVTHLVTRATNYGSEELPGSTVGEHEPVVARCWRIYRRPGRRQCPHRAKANLRLPSRLLVQDASRTQFPVGRADASPLAGEQLLRLARLGWLPSPGVRLTFCSVVRARVQERPAAVRYVARIVAGGPQSDCLSYGGVAVSASVDVGQLLDQRSAVVSAQRLDRHIERTPRCVGRGRRR